ncbi:MAG: nitronate monooxygenase [Oscillospiraceae bacterium]|jgi:enoyl-[acyl-carrier protein] reductase II|nr:nitronate monooxygenase [Oscillospiraceae bacterium]
MDLRTLLGIEYPIIQGGMANIATGGFAAAVSNGGGLGLVSAGGFSIEQLRENIRLAKSLTSKPFGVNIMLMHPDADKAAEVVAEEGVKIVTTGAGSPGKYMQGWKDAGIKVFPVVPSVAHARRMEAIGADGVIAEGTESGGHVGELTTMALVPQVKGAVNIPVVAAGGIASGGQMLAAFALGAIGVQIGTALLVSEECPIHENYKLAVIKAKDTGTTVTGRNGGVPVRIIKNQMTREYLLREKEGAGKEELEEFTLGSLRRAVYEGDTNRGSLMAGQVAGQLTEIRPAVVILKELFEDCKKTAELLRDSSIMR